MILGRLFESAPPPGSGWDGEPIRGELFGIERLEEHAASLAAAQPVLALRAKGRPLSGRLSENAAFLLRANRAIAKSIEDRRHVTPAAEWLIDNYHLVDMQIREIGIDLPPRYYAQLAKLADGPFVGLPRIFGAMWSFVAHSDSHLQPEALQRYLLAYQAVQPLTIGELWAVPITLRIVLIENLRRMAELVVDNASAREQADDLSDRLRSETPKADVAALLAAVPPVFSDAFAVQMAHRLRGQDHGNSLTLAWLHARLGARETTIEIVVQEELQRQGTSSATIRNTINSLRSIAAIDWTEFFERVCPIDAILAESGPFREMDFPTRNLYRTAIEELARFSPLTELEIARRAVAAAAAATEGRRSDPGYYLVAAGRKAFEGAVGYRPKPGAWLGRSCRASGIAGYAIAVVALAAAIVAGLLLLIHALGAGVPGFGLPWLALLGLAGFIPASDAAMACVNRIAGSALSATTLPGLSLDAGIPVPLRTLVAVPTMLTSAAAIAEQVERLEIHHLSSRDGELHFALLTDWADGPAEHSDTDAMLLAEAVAGIDRLNHRHAAGSGGARFFLLHRRRVWNAGEAAWIGWERKRGKLHELNRLLRGATDTSFLDPPALPAGVRYVVTLDADTMLPRDTVRRLVGKLAHPLNAPRIDASSGRVVEGYAVLQPRVTPLLPVGTGGSSFQQVFSSMDGIDPYGGAVSDVYQDLFGEGSYAGKGIYDVDAFERALQGRVPDSTLLSHDLFEGVFARAGLASDIEVVEAFPSSYVVAALRQHRWARGDWQLLPWIGAGKAISVIGRWKMLDNLRRTLSAPAALVALMIGWQLPFGAALTWTLFVLGTIAVPAFLPVIGEIVPGSRWVSLRSYVGAIGRAVARAAALAGLTSVFIADQAVLMSDAIIRTGVRVFWTRRHLLQWVTAAQDADGPLLGRGGYYRRMAGAPALGAIAGAAAIWSPPEVWLLTAPFALAWIAAPAIAYWSSQDGAAHRPPAASSADRRALLATARRTWRFFETFVTPRDNMLPPDNFQETPAPVVAHRTSPTNIGLYLLSAVSAHDLGWAGLSDTVERVEATFATLARLQRFRGHLYNWYDTSDLRPLEPLYVSTVDSGNLAGHLIALAESCRGWREHALPGGSGTSGLATTVDLARAEMARWTGTGPLRSAGTAKLEGALAALASRTRDGSPALSADILASLEADAAQAAEHGRALAEAGGDGRDPDELVFWTAAIQRTIASHRRDFDPLADLDLRLERLESAARAMAMAMEFGFLRNTERKLLSIGYLVAEGALDSNCYDLLASEARLACFVAIAKDDVPAREWFRLGRAVTPAGGGAALVSWSGSMFEYLMPSLVMRAPAPGLLATTSRLIVRAQIEFGAARGAPWGVSESAYNVRDLEYTYQYSNFGVPSLGLKRGLDADLVIAPYATALAAMVDAPAAVQNFARLAGAGALGRYGWYEALDYTPARIPDGQSVAVVRAFMAHHQGMTIVALADTVLEGRMRARFHASPMIRATELLLQERAPRNVPVARPLPMDPKPSAHGKGVVPSAGRHYTAAQRATPATHLLSNGSYAVMLTASGSGYSRWQDLAVTRWREDPTLDDWGSYIYLRDVLGGPAWSAGLQPSGLVPDRYDVTFSEDRAEFARRDGTLSTVMEVLVSAEEDAEVRRISVSNTGRHTRTIEITSYAELALIAAAADLAHPAFAKLFVQTERLAQSGAVVATRRRRTPAEQEIWAGHLVVLEHGSQDDVQVETDRARFLGRGHGVRDPAAITSGALSGTVGTVLDAVFALRCRVIVAPGAMVRVAFWTMVAPSRQALVNTIDKHRDVTAFDRASTLAWTQAQVQLRHLDIRPAQAELFQRLAGYLVFAGPALRAGSDTIRLGAGPQSGLWPQGISGDLPILLLRIRDADDIEVARELMLAHEYFRLKQFAVDLVIVNEHAASYSQELQIALEALLRTQPRTPPAPGAAPKGAVFLLRADLLAPETAALLASVARAVLVADRGRLSEQLREPAAVPRAKTALVRRDPGAAVPPVPRLEFFNGLGGFADDGREYVVVLGPGKTTPAPWINVVANPGFGFLASAEGGGYSWAGNSRENQITPWSNDPVTDRPGEAFYLRDDETGDVWCPTASPRRDPAATYVARHGYGYSRFDRVAFGIASRLLQAVPTDDPVKISRLELHNLSGRARSITVSAYAEWVLGPSRTATAPFVVTEMDPPTGAMFARNAWNAVVRQSVAFADLRGAQTSWTADRREFIGRDGTLAAPEAVTNATVLSGRVGAGLDPCGVLRTTVHLLPGARAEIVLLLGEGTTGEDARRLVELYRQADLDAVQEAVRRQWAGVLGAVQVKTPDRSMDLMLNGWFLYQALACRVWARAGFYQASGAYGFRDQLQDGMALTAARPDLVREHLLRAASRQFVEGDVQHWWLPESGMGVRTRIADDCAWLAYTIAHYVEATGDAAVLDQNVAFLTAAPLAAGEHDRFFAPATGEAGSLFEHGARALDHSLAVGSHGLPLMGTGDWNDGMSRVGEGGRGESVWLGWFLHAALTAYAPLAEARGDARAALWRAAAEALAPALEAAWDGEWYLRAYYDDGTPLGSHADRECRIDSIPQSWAVLSGVAPVERAARAMASVRRELVDLDQGLLRVLAPPFDGTAHDPGYIKGYPAGIRENGGQYTHAAAWTVLAFAALGDGDQAAQLFALLNPINRALTPEAVARSKVEPYAVVADVYSHPPHVGRGGWSWYTGSAGWMQRAGIEGVLGICIRNGALDVDPCIPRLWPRFEATITWRSARYRIMVENTGGSGRGVISVKLDGVEAARGTTLALADDDVAHTVEIVLG